MINWRQTPSFIIGDHSKEFPILTASTLVPKDSHEHLSVTNDDPVYKGNLETQSLEKKTSKIGMEAYQTLMKSKSGCSTKVQKEKRYSPETLLTDQDMEVLKRKKE
jgi:hypothetical protein